MGDACGPVVKRQLARTIIHYRIFHHRLQQLP